ncbi:12170_t:CDS:2, partial [Gigaspora rosea]
SGDVKITVQGQTIFASSSILAKRSEYFQRMFNGSWLECNQSINAQHMIEDDTISNDLDINNCPNIWNLYTIANKYLITDLEMEAKLKILEGMSINTAAESLFGNAWKWPDLKKRFF